MKKRCIIQQNIIFQSSLGGSSPLHLASENNNFKVAKILLENGADPEVTHIVLGYNALRLAVQQGHCDIARLLLLHGADVLRQSEADSMSPLLVAISRGDEAILDCIINTLKSTQKGISADIWAKMVLYGQTALLEKHMKTKEEFVKLRDYLDQDGNTAIHLAVLSDSAKIVEIACSLFGTFLFNVTNSSGHTAWDLAYERGVTEITKVWGNYASKITKDKKGTLKEKKKSENKTGLSQSILSIMSLMFPVYSLVRERLPSELWTDQWLNDIPVKPVKNDKNSTLYHKGY